MTPRNARRLIAASLLLTSCDYRLPPGLDDVPEEVAAFVETRSQCDHLRGEIAESGVIGSNSPTIDDINQACAGTDRRLAKLRAKYAHDPRVMTALSVYEWPIEAKC